MPEPPLHKYPAEIFGYPYSDVSPAVQESRKQQHCPFLQGECKKPRKSQPHIKVGVCSVGYKGGLSDKHLPIIICPHRFELEVVKETIRQFYLPTAPELGIQWIPEVHLGKAIGYVDYVGATLQPSTGHVTDFVCVEVQAAGTTGTPWEAFQEHKKLKRFKRESYNFGINWANEFAKTMMQQAYKKGLIIERWNKPLVFVIQDIGLQYLESSYDTSGLRPANPADAIHFCTFNMVWNEAQSGWKQQLTRRVSTNTEGIRKMLGGLAKDDLPSESQFVAQIEKKLRRL